MAIVVGWGGISFYRSLGSVQGFSVSGVYDLAPVNFLGKPLRSTFIYSWNSREVSEAYKKGLDRGRGFYTD